MERGASAIVVTALGLSPQRRQALQDALSGLSRVELRFRDPQPMRAPERRVPESSTGTAAPLIPGIESRMGRAVAEEFVNRTIEASESCLVRAHALRELAQHYPPDIEAQLAPAHRALLDSLLANHYAGFESASRRVIDQARQIAGPTAPSQQVPAQSWQAHSQSLVAAVEQVDSALTRLLAGGGGPGGQQSLTSELDRGLRRLEAETSAAAPAFRRER